MADKNFYINFDRGTRVKSDGSQDTSVASLYYQEVPSWTIKFIDESQAAVDVSSVTAWAAAVDDDFDDGSDPWCRILNADIDSTDAATGIITIPLDSNTATFEAGIGTSEYKQAYFELRGLNAGSELIAYVRFTILAKNTLDPSGGTPPAPTGNYYTKTEADSKFVDASGDTMTGDLTMGKNSDNSSITFEDYDTPASATPAEINMGNSFHDGATAGVASKAKIKIYEDGTYRSGISQGPLKLEYYCIGVNTANDGHSFWRGTNTGAGTLLFQINADNTIQIPATTVAGLPSAGTAGRKAFVTDANATTFASIVAGGGANGVPVYDDGTNWRIG